jgi:hypothetical protein
MIFLVIRFLHASLPIYQPSDVNSTLAKAGGHHDVYFLVLFKMPTDIEATSEAFTRVISAIPIITDPLLGIVIDPEAPANEVLYSGRNGGRACVRFPYQTMMRNHSSYLNRSLNSKLQSNFDSLIDGLRTFHRASKSEHSQNPLKHQFEVRRVKQNFTTAVVDLASSKNHERVNLIRFALAIQEMIESGLPRQSRHRLPSFSEIDPTGPQSVIDEDARPPNKQKEVFPSNDGSPIRGTRTAALPGFLNQVKSQKDRDPLGTQNRVKERRNHPVGIAAKELHREKTRNAFTEIARGDKVADRGLTGKQRPGGAKDDDKTVIAPGPRTERKSDRKTPGGSSDSVGKKRPDTNSRAGQVGKAPTDFRQLRADRPV